MGELIQVLYPSIILTVVACTHISVAVALPPGSLLLAPFYYNCETPQAGKWNCGPIGSHCHWIWCSVRSNTFSSQCWCKKGALQKSQCKGSLPWSLSSDSEK